MRCLLLGNVAGRAAARAILVVLASNVYAFQEDNLGQGSAGLAEEFSKFRDPFASAEALGQLAAHVCPKSLDLGRRYWTQGEAIYQQAKPAPGSEARQVRALRALTLAAGPCRLAPDRVSEVAGKNAGPAHWAQTAQALIASDPELALDYLTRASQFALTSESQTRLSLTAESLRAARPDLANELVARQMTFLTGRPGSTVE